MICDGYCEGLVISRVQIWDFYNTVYTF